MWYPTLPDVLHLHDQICAVQDVPARVTKMPAIDEAILAPQRTDKEDRSAEIIARKCAALLFPLVSRNPFEHCGDRVAYSIAQQFVDRNGFVLRVSVEEAVPAFDAVRSGETEREDLASWLESSLRTRFDTAHRDRVFSALNTLAEVKEDLSQVAGHDYQVEQIDVVGHVLSQQMAALFRLDNDVKKQLQDRFPCFWDAWKEALVLKQG